MAFFSEKEQLQKFEEDELAQAYFEILRELIAKKSIFAQQIGLKEVADYLREVFEEAGAEVTVDASYRAPFVIARFKSSDPNAKSIIFYNHYDTVPADSDQPWTEDPFTLSVRDGVMYGRGVDDDKGHIVARLTALQKYREGKQDLPVNVTFIIEGAEESASTDLDRYLEKHKEELSGADLLIWEQGSRNALGQLEITGGNKGIVTFDAKVKSADVDIHSSFGGVIDSSSWYLLNALASLRRADGRILVEGIYEQIVEPNERELALVEEFARRNPEELKQIYGLELPLLEEEGQKFLRRYFFEPAINIEGLSSGYQGQGVKTILPSEAKAKLEVRLVPKVELIYTLGEMSYRSDMRAPSVLSVIELAKKYYSEGVAVLPTSAGTGPMFTVYDALKVPMMAFGLGHANSRDHGGDENVRLADYYTHIELVKELIASYE